MQPQITLVELPATSFGQLNGGVVKDIYSGSNLPSRASPLLHAILLKEGYSDVRSIDPNYNSSPGNLSSEDFTRICKSDYLLLSAITRTISQTQRLAEIYRETNPDGKVIVGGPHATFHSEDCLQWADVVVKNEGDKTLPELMKKLEENGSPAGVKGISYKGNEGIVHEELQKPLNETELSNLPLPFYEEPVRKGRTYLTISTSRGCPFTCNFCTVKLMYSDKYVRKSNESILEELDSLMEEPQKPVFFTDDNFAGKKGPTKELLQGMIDYGFNTKRYLVQLSIHSAFDSELLGLMKEAGVSTTYVGVESINEETLKSLGKRATVEKNKEAIKLFREAGIWVHGMMIVGADGDTKESLEETLTWTKENFDSVQFFAPVPLPGTGFAQQMEEQGRILTKDYHLYDAQHVTIRPKNFRPDELQETILDMHRRFYSLWKSPRAVMNSVHSSGKLVIDFLARRIIKSIASDSQTKNHLEFLKTVG